MASSLTSNTQVATTVDSQGRNLDSSLEANVKLEVVLGIHGPVHDRAVKLLGGKPRREVALQAVGLVGRVES